MRAAPSHSGNLPERQYRQRPHGPYNASTTWSPGATSVTPRPTSSTTPAPSWPSTSGSTATGDVPCSTCRSDPHTPVAATRTSTSPGCGGPTSMSSIAAPDSRTTTARVAVMLGSSGPSAVQRLRGHGDGGVDVGAVDAGGELAGAGELEHRPQPRAQARDRPCAHVTARRTVERHDQVVLAGVDVVVVRVVVEQIEPQLLVAGGPVADVEGEALVVQDGRLRCVLTRLAHGDVPVRRGDHRGVHVAVLDADREGAGLDVAGVLGNGRHRRPVVVRADHLVTVGPGG